LTSGNGLLAEQGNKDDAQGKSDAEKWVTESRAAYGDGEAALFLDDSGYTFYGDRSAKSMMRYWIDVPMRRITELLRRTDSLV
jgi:hypothetical protein